MSARRSVAVVGGGAMGQYIGARLATAGHQVKLLLRSDYEVVQNEGIRVTSPHGNLHVYPGDNFKVFKDSRDIGPSDWVVCALKSDAFLNGNEDATKKGGTAKDLITPCLGRDTRVLSLLNGIGIDEIMADHIVKDPLRVLGGLAYVAVSREGPGEIKHVFTEKMTIGHKMDDSNMVDEACALLKDCHVNPQATSSLIRSRWEKVAWNFPFAGMGVVAGGVPCGVLMADPAIRSLTKNVMQEVFQTANADILHHYDGDEEVIPEGFVEDLWKMSQSEKLEEYLPSTVIDYLAKKPVEKEFIFSEPVARADRLGLEVPHMRMISGLVDMLTTKSEKQQDRTVLATGESKHAVTSLVGRNSSTASVGIRREPLSGHRGLKKDMYGRGFSSSAATQKSDVGEKVLEQYDSEQTRTFYRTVMGGGGNDIHFGVFRRKDDDVKKAAGNTTDMMLNLLNWVKPIEMTSQVLDLGSGHGGSAHKMVSRFQNHITCFNIGKQQNIMNLEEAKRLGIEDKIECTVGDFNFGLEEKWTETFDHVFSCEVLCHAADKPALLSEIRRVLKPSGVFVFSDIMGADGASEELLRPFTDRNATTMMGRPSQYKYQLEEAGLREVAYVDLSSNLAEFFQLMLNQVQNNYEDLQSEGLPDEYLDNWIRSLSDRVSAQKEHGVFAWGIFAAVKD